MPTTITAQTVTRLTNGMLLSLESAASTMDYVGTSGLFVYVVNADAAPTTMTVTSQNLVDGNVIADYTAVITNGTSRMIGPFPAAHYNDSSDPPQVDIAFSNVTSVTVAVIGL